MISRRNMISLIGAVPVWAYPVMLQGQKPECALQLNLYAYDGKSHFVIAIPESAEPADRIIVRTVYLQHTERFGTLHRTKTEVVSFMPGMSMGGGPIPAPPKDIVRVEMEVVRRVCVIVEEFERGE